MSRQGVSAGAAKRLASALKSGRDCCYNHPTRCSPVPRPVNPDGTTRFSTADLPAPLRFDAWREATAPFFDTQPLARAGALRGHIQATPVHGLMVGFTGFNAQRYHRDQRRISLGGLDHCLAQVFVQGGLRGEHAGGALQVGPGELCVFDLARPFRSEVRAGATVSILLPRALLPADAQVPHGLVLQRTHAGARLLIEHLQALAREAHELDAAEQAAAAQATLALWQGALRCSAGACTLQRDLGQRLRAYIATHLAEPELGPEHLQRQFGLSRAVLYRQFAAEGGVAAHIRKARLDQCLREIGLQPRRVQLTELLYRWGFASDQQFTRAFRRRFGVTPSAWQRMALQGPPPIPNLAALLRHFERLARQPALHAAVR